jgi:hypothetical protein
MALGKAQALKTMKLSRQELLMKLAPRASEPTPPRGGRSHGDLRRARCYGFGELDVLACDAGVKQVALQHGAFDVGVRLITEEGTRRAGAGGARAG